ncbi:MAG: sigma-70 family RNA polymerase sigma factor [Caldilineaceae bacterium]
MIDTVFTTLSDEDLLKRISSQDLRAYEVLYDRHAESMYGLIMRMIHDRHLAEDLLQETFWQVWQNAHQYQGHGVAAAWLFRIARNRCLDELRRQRARPSSAAPDIANMLEQHDLNQQDTSAETQPEIAFSRNRIQEALNDIPPDQRTCLEWAYFDGYTQREIAEIINVPLGTVKSRMRIGLEKLERLLRSAGFP